MFLNDDGAIAGLPDGPFEAFLFDLDGTVADSMPLHYRSWNEAMAAYGAVFPPDLFDAMAGTPFDKTVELLNAKLGYALPIAEVVRRKEATYRALASSMKAVPSVLEVIDAHFERVPFAIVSGSPRASIESTLATLKLRDRFQVIVGAEDYVHGKPDPEPFLLAAKLLNVAPEKCLVFEDAPQGIAAAKAAHMKWVLVPSTPTT